MTRGNKSFASLFKKYRLRSEIETLAEFGDLLAQEGIVYENSLFTRWQKGERVPSDRRVVLLMLRIFIKRGGITSLNEANGFLESLGMSFLNEVEIRSLPSSKELDNVILRASLGGLIKDFRNQKNISQLEMSFAMGWDNVSKLEEIEQGKASKPTRNLIDRISLIMGLNTIEKNKLLLAGNYLPTEEEINITRKKTKNILDNWPYPAVLLDFSWRVIDHNKKNVEMNRITPELYEYIYINHPTVLEILFHPDFVANQYLKEKEQQEWKRWLSKIVLHYKFIHQSRKNEDWYISLIKRLMKNNLFLEIWSNLDYQNDSRPIVTKHGTKTVVHPKDNDRRFNLSFFIVPLLEDPRFEIEFYTPADKLSSIYFST